MKEYDYPVMPMKSRIALMSVEYGTVEQDGSALAVVDRSGVRIQLPVGASAVLMLEPGTSITHAAVKLCAESRTLIIWTGEAGVRLYSAGQEGSAHSYRLLRQARLALNDRSRLAVAREMYRIRFNEEIPKRRSINQLRGMEGARVRALYRSLSDEFDVPWHGRNYDRNAWAEQDDINRAISAANSCLYGLCHAAILIAGYSAAIGFIHTGYPLAFVHDLADIWKMDLSVRTAFQVVSQSPEAVSTRVRHALRDLFRTHGLLDTIIPTIHQLLDAGEKDGTPPDELGGTREEATDAWDFPWYRQSDGGETVARTRESADASMPEGESSEEAEASAVLPREEKPSAEHDAPPPMPTIDSKGRDEGEVWADEMFGAFEDPWAGEDQT